MSVNISSDHFQSLKLLWDIFNKFDMCENIQIAGGLAARCYGAKRPLNDIDINMNKKDILVVVKELTMIPQIKILFGPSEYLDFEWKLFMVTLKSGPIEIDLCDVNDQYCFCNNVWNKIPDSRNKDLVFNFSDMQGNSVEMKVMSPEELINYKQFLRWPKHRIDELATREYLSKGHDINKEGL